MPDRKRLLILTGIAAALGIAVYTTRTAPGPAPVPVAIAVAPPAPAVPIAPPPPPPPPAPAVAQRGSIPGLSINATFATRGSGGSILVTRADGTRATILTGTDAAPGIRLTGVAPDRAIFTTGGTVFWVPLRSETAAKADPGPAVVATAALPPPVASGPTATELRESQAYQAALAPSLDGAYRGYTVRGTMPLFAKAGLKPGDVITGINGRAFDSPAEIAKLSREAAISATVTFQIRRAGKTQELQVQPR